MKAALLFLMSSIENIPAPPGSPVLMTRVSTGELLRVYLQLKTFQMTKRTINNYAAPNGSSITITTKNLVYLNVCYIRDIKCTDLRIIRRIIT
jgi:hypothetical protein